MNMQQYRRNQYGSRCHRVAVVVISIFLTGKVLRKEHILNLCTSPDVVTKTISRSMRWEGNVIRRGVNVTSCEVSGVKVK
jgi:hypothetical protein